MDRKLLRQHGFLVNIHVKTQELTRDIHADTENIGKSQFAQFHIQDCQRRRIALADVEFHESMVLI